MNYTIINLWTRYIHASTPEYCVHYKRCFESYNSNRKKHVIDFQMTNFDPLLWNRGNILFSTTVDRYRYLIITCLIRTKHGTVTGCLYMSKVKSRIKTVVLNWSLIVFSLSLKVENLRTMIGPRKIASTRSRSNWLSRHRNSCVHY